MNEMVGMKKRLMMYGGKKRFVFTFRRQEFWKFIGFVIWSVTYGRNGKNIWIEITKHIGKNPPTKLQRDVLGNTDLYNICCDIYCTYYCYACHQIII